MIYGIDISDGIQPDRCVMTTFGAGGVILETVEIKNLRPPEDGDVEIFDAPPRAAEEAWRTVPFTWPIASTPL